MKKLLLGCALAFGFAACGGGGGGDMVGKAEGLATSICECKEFDCTKPKMAELNKLSIKSAKEVAKLSDEDRKKFVAASSKASECQVKLRMPAKP